MANINRKVWILQVKSNTDLCISGTVFARCRYFTLTAFSGNKCCSIAVTLIHIVMDFELSAATILRH